MHRQAVTTFFLLTILSLTGFNTVSTQPSSTPPMMYGRLAVNQTHIVFSYAGDLWTVERGGGEARRLTTHPGEENFPAFSPDGSQLAFSRQVGGNRDVYVMPAAGGEAKRITYHPRNDLACGWTPDGRSLLFNSDRSGETRLYAVATDGVMPRELPLPQAWVASYSPDAKRIAYAPNSGIGNWRYYRGGDNGRIWLVNAGDWSVEKLSQGAHNDEFPMWVGDKIWFISDRTGIFNLFVYDLTSKQTRQMTSYEKYGIRWAAAGAGAIAFVRDGRIHLYDIAGNQTRVVDVKVNADAAELKPRTVNAARTIEWIVPSAKGERVVIGARGDVLIFDPTNGEARNVTASAGVAERWPTLSPDGRSLAYFSDGSGEYQLHVRPMSGEEAVKKIAIEPKPSFYPELTWSPDSRKVAFTDKRLALWVADVERGTAARVDCSTYSYQEEWRPRWSPDGRWLTYSKHLRNRVRTVFIYDIEAKKVRRITDGITHTELPCFDANGKYLYFVSSPNAGTSEYGWGVLNGVLARPLVTRRLHAVVLAADGPPPPLPDGTPNADAKMNEAVTSVRIDFENIGRRVIDLSVPNRDYALLIPGKPGALWAQINEWPVAPSPASNGNLVLYAIDLSKPLRLEKFAGNIGDVEISTDGSHVLFGRGQNWSLVASSSAPKPDEGRLDFKHDQGFHRAILPMAEKTQGENGVARSPGGNSVV